MADEKKNSAPETAEEIEGAYVHQFKTPFKWDGKEYDSLTFDFESLTGADVIKIIDEQSMLGGNVAPIRQFDVHFQLGVAVRACNEKLGQDAYLAMKMGDLNKILDRARGFLLAQGF